jgi:hypothetical protein
MSLLYSRQSLIENLQHTLTGLESTRTLNKHRSTKNGKLGKEALDQFTLLLKNIRALPNLDILTYQIPFKTINVVPTV